MTPLALVPPNARWLTAFVLLLTLGAFAVAAAACGGEDGSRRPSAAASNASSSPAAAAPTTTDEPIEGEVTVFAASSLTDAFKEAGRRFEALHPGTSVRFNFAASSALAVQINEGGPADVFASADNAQMKAVVDAGYASAPRQFASNVPVVVVPKDGAMVRSFADLANPGVHLVLAAPEVPIGKYARDILANASKPGGIAPDFAERALANLKSNEANVRAVLAKVQLGEADAGIAYSTDAATASNDVRVIEVPRPYNVIAQYPIAVVKGSDDLPAAQAWVDFILSPEGQDILARFGFGKPTPS